VYDNVSAGKKENYMFAGLSTIHITNNEIFEYFMYILNSCVV